MTAEEKAELLKRLTQQMRLAEEECDHPAAFRIWKSITELKKAKTQ